MGTTANLIKIRSLKIKKLKFINFNMQHPPKYERVDFWMLSIYESNILIFQRADSNIGTFKHWRLRWANEYVRLYAPHFFIILKTWSKSLRCLDPLPLKRPFNQHLVNVVSKDEKYGILSIYSAKCNLFFHHTFR